MNPETPPPLLDPDLPLSMDAPEKGPEEGPEDVQADLLPHEPVPEPEHVALFVGGGHMSQEAARLAHYAGFSVEVLDIREDYVKKELFPDAAHVQLCIGYEDMTEDYLVESRHYVVILTHSFETDLEVLAQVLESPARYIGVAGSPRKKEKLFAALRTRGVPDAELACVRCPIGLAIGAESPQEMAIAIAGELVAARAGCLARPLSRRLGTHGRKKSATSPAASTSSS